MLYGVLGHKSLAVMMSMMAFTSDYKCRSHNRSGTSGRNERLRVACPRTLCRFTLQVTRGCYYQHTTIHPCVRHCVSGVVYHPGPVWLIFHLLSVHVSQNNESFIYPQSKYYSSKIFKKYTIELYPSYLEYYKLAFLISFRGVANTRTPPIIYCET